MQQQKPKKIENKNIQQPKLCSLNQNKSCKLVLLVLCVLYLHFQQNLKQNGNERKYIIYIYKKSFQRHDLIMFTS